MSKAPKAIDERRWQAESLVRGKIEKTPEYKKAVNQTIKELKKIEARVRVTVPKKR